MASASHQVHMLDHGQSGEHQLAGQLLDARQSSAPKAHAAEAGVDAGGQQLPHTPIPGRCPGGEWLRGQSAAASGFRPSLGRSYASPGAAPAAPAAATAIELAPGRAAGPVVELDAQEAVVFVVGGEAMARVDSHGAWQRLIGQQAKRRVMQKHHEEVAALRADNGRLTKELRSATQRKSAASGGRADPQAC